MIKIHRDNLVIFWLLIGGLVLNILWSFRLELQAKNLQTIVENYHLSLNENMDEIYNLKSFHRSAENGSISAKNDSASFWLNSNGQIGMAQGQSWITMNKEEDNIIHFLSKGTGPSHSEMMLSEDGFSLKARGKNEPVNFKMDGEYIDIRHHNSILKIGNIPMGEGISMGVKDWGTVAIIKDEGIGLVSSKKIILEAQGEHAELAIVSDGDINIRSKNGVVKINGKKIHMNK
jgi:hypothetical protein